METNYEDEDLPRRSYRNKLQSVVDTTKEGLRQVFHMMKGNNQLEVPQVSLRVSW